MVVTGLRQRGSTGEFKGPLHCYFFSFTLTRSGSNCESSIYGSNSLLFVLERNTKNHITVTPVGWECIIHQLHLCRGITHPPLPSNVPDLTLNHWMMRFQFLVFGDSGVTLHFISGVTVDGINLLSALTLASTVQQRQTWGRKAAGSGGRAASLTLLSPLYNTGLCCPV